MKTSLTQILAQFDQERSSQEEFLKAFKVAVETLTKMKSAVGADLNQLRLTFDRAVSDLKDFNQQSLKETQGQLLERIDTALKEQQSGLNYMRDWVRNISVKDGEDGQPGKDADEQAVIEAVLARIPPDIEETGDQIIDKINSADKMISASAIMGLEDELKKIGESAKRSGQIPGWGAHPLNIYNSTGTVIDNVTRHIKFTGATTTRSSDGVVTVAVSASGNTFVYNEVVSGSATTFTLAHTPASGTLVLYANGQRLTPTTDYSLVTATITTVSSWSTGAILADYQY